MSLPTTVMLAGLCFGGLWVVWLVSSFVPVDGRRLPALLRAGRFPISRPNVPGIVQIGVPFRTRSRDNVWGWRFLVGLLTVLSQTAQLRSITDALSSPTVDSLPILQACIEWVLMALWSIYVVVEFRRAARSRQ